MAEQRTTGQRVAIWLMMAWIAAWIVGMLVVIWGFVQALLSGDMGGMAIMAIWLAAAGFGLAYGGRKLRQLVAATGNEEPGDGG